MKKKPKKPHDVFIKAMLADIARARTFLKRLLPAELTAQLDLETLQPDNSTFIRADLSEYFSDAVYRVQLKNQEMQEALVSILLEHKSYPDKQVVLQLLSYLVEGYRTQSKLDEHWKEMPDTRGSTLRLRPIIPFLFCHGSSYWEYRPLPALFDAQYEGFMRYVPTFDVLSTHLSKLPESEILDLQDGWLRAALLTQKFSHDPKALMDRISTIFQTLAEARGGNFIELLTVYFISIVPIDRTQFDRLLDDIPTTLKPQIMTLYDSIVQFGIQKGIERGIAQGIEQGVEQGVEKGQAQGKQEVILVGHRNGISVDVLSLLTGYSIEEVQRIIESQQRG